MKITILKLVEIEVKQIWVSLPVRYEEEDMPNDFPMRDGDSWQAHIDVETGVIEDWPQGKTGEFYMKVTDSGCYHLIGASGEVLSALDGEYVPHGVVPGEYGDYVGFEIDENGKIVNWPAPEDLDFSAFFPDNSDE